MVKTLANGKEKTGGSQVDKCLHLSHTTYHGLFCAAHLGIHCMKRKYACLGMSWLVVKL